MKVKIVAHAPTNYQSNSLSAFNLETTWNPGGGYGVKVFNSVKEARSYLKERAYAYYMEGECNNKAYRDALQDIKGGRFSIGQLTIDAVTARIEKND